jgi:hypothetical protein
VALITEWLDAYKRERGCADCGTDEGRLDLDHRDGEVKLFNPSQQKSLSPRFLAEVAKCDVRCISCHARRHMVARNRARAKLTPEMVEAIKESTERGIDLARRYGVSQQRVSNIRCGRG